MERDGSAELSAEDVARVRERLKELETLEDGWGEYGDEVAPDKEGLRRLSELFSEHGVGIPVPYIYPTCEGGIQLEWVFGSSAEMEVGLKEMRGILYLGDGEIEVDLSTASGWRMLIEALDSVPDGGDHLQSCRFFIPMGKIG